MQAQSWGGIEVFPVDIRGDGLCLFRYDAKNFTLNAHCNHPAHGKLCRRGRVVNVHPRAPARNKSQGRPGGTLLAWLACADEFPDGASHMAEMRQARTSEFFDQVIRADKRLWVEENAPAFHAFLVAAERPPWPDEADEPELPT